MNLPSLLPLRDIIERYGLAAKKSLGQHFLLDGNITNKIVKIAGNLAGVNVTEIGPGPGGLTRSILTSEAAHVYALEKDERCIAALADLSPAFANRLTVISADAMAISPLSFSESPRAIIANLPYNVGTALLLQWLGEIAVHGNGAYQSLTLMFQKEVAERLYAQPRTKAYGRLSVMTQWLCKVEHAFDLPPEAFTPPPKVSSTVVKLTPYPSPLFSCNAKILERTLASAFGQRRKMLRSALSASATDTISWLTKADIDPTRRAETLSVEEFCRLANHFPAGVAS